MNTKSIVLVALMLGVLALSGYFLMSPAADGNIKPMTKEFTLSVSEKKIVRGPSTLHAKQGDTVVINITSDEIEEFHLHGYDRSVDLEPNVKAMLTFVADASGRFPFELEKTKTELGALEVQP